VRLNGPKVGAQTLGACFSDTTERFLIEVENAVMRHYQAVAPGLVSVAATLVQLSSEAAVLVDA
jgi:hypothetical protein